MDHSLTVVNVKTTRAVYIPPIRSSTKALTSRASLYACENPGGKAARGSDMIGADNGAPVRSTSAVKLYRNGACQMCFMPDRICH